MSDDLFVWHCVSSRKVEDFRSRAEAAWAARSREGMICDMSCLHFVSVNIRPSRCVINNYMCVLSYYSMNDISSSLLISSFFSQNRFDASLYILYRRKKTALQCFIY